MPAVVCWEHNRCLCKVGHWASTKKACLYQNNTNTGLYKHFANGCPAHTRDLSHLRWTLVDYVDTSTDQLNIAGHESGAKCRCSECLKLKQQEDKWVWTIEQQLASCALTPATFIDNFGSVRS